MSLRIRRGTDAERSGVTFLEGELVYTTDTKKMFVGDGTTVGGIAVDSTAGSINQMSDVNIVGIQTGQILQWDGSQFIAGDDAGDKESVTGADSTILVDATNSSVNLDGTVKGHIIPDQNEVYDLGSSTKRFNDLYLSGTTINLGGATITATGGEITMSQPMNVEVKSTGNVDTNDNTITNTGAGGHITVAPLAGKQFRVDDVVGGTSFSVDTTAKSVNVNNGYGLKLATFASADYTAIAGSEQSGQIVFDNSSKALKIYNGTAWVQVSGSGGGGGAGVMEGQTYDINITGDVISDDSTVALNTASKDLSLISGSFSGILAAGTLNATNVNGLLKGNILHADNAVFLDNTTKSVVATNGDFNYLRATTLDGNIIGPDSTIMINTSNRSLNVGSITATDLDVNGSAFADDLTVTTNVFAVNMVASGKFTGNIDGNVKGDVKSTGGQTVLDSGTNGTDATFVGTVDGNITGSVFGEDSALLIDGINSEIVGSINAQEILKVAVPDAVGSSNAVQIFNFNGTIDNPSEPGNMDKRSIKFRDHNGTSFYDSAIIAGYHQTAGGGYLGISPVSQDNATLFDTAIEMDGNTGSILLAGGIKGKVQTISGPGAINTTSLITEITTTGADAYTLANGASGQVKIIIMTVDGGDATITPTTFSNGTNITLDAVNDTVTLVYGPAGWIVTALQGAVVA